MLSIPVEFDSILRQMFAGAPDVGGLDALQPRVEDLRRRAKTGDHEGFARVIADLCAGPAGLALPLCDPCLELAVKDRSRAVGEACARRDTCLSTLSAVRSSAQPSLLSPGGPAGLDSLRAALTAEGARQQGRLAAARRRGAALTRRAARLAAQERLASRLECQLWAETGVVRQALGSCRDTLDSIRAREERLRVQVGRLRGLSVLSDAFFVWHRGPYVTINSARLGRLPGQTVEWSEINAGLGQFALAMCVTAQRVGFAFPKYRVIPMGSYARLIPVGEDAYSGGRGLDVFWSPGALLEGALGLPFFSTSKLNAAVKALMTSLADLISHAEALDASFRVPHAVSGSGERVGDVPTAVGRDVQWTRAMKLAATDLKWLIAWAHKQPLPL